MTSDAPIGSFIRMVMLELLPLLSIAFLALLTTIPFSLPDSIRLGGLFPLIGITFWTLVRPKSMSPILVFILGIFTDIMTFSPFGLHALVFLFLQALLKKQRRFLVGQGFWVMWAAFALFAISFYALVWFFSFITTGASIPFHAAALAVLISWACVPLVLWLLSLLHDLIDLFDEPLA